MFPSMMCGPLSPLAKMVQSWLTSNESREPSLPSDVEAAISPAACPERIAACSPDDMADGPAQTPSKATFTVGNQLRRTVFASWLNILLLAVPIGITINFIPSVSRIAVFAVNFAAIVPLAALLSLGTEEVALRTGDVLGALINATLGNAVELIVAIIALTQGKTAIVQTSLIGSILSNLLLVLGMCFFFGGLKRRYQFFNTTAAQAATGMLAVALAGVIIPTVFSYNSGTHGFDVASISRGTAVILLVVYTAYLWFQLHTHPTDASEDETTKVDKASNARIPGGTSDDANNAATSNIEINAETTNVVTNNIDETAIAKITNVEAAIVPSNPKADDKEPKLHALVALALLVLSTAAIAVCAEFMVDSIDAVVSKGVSTEFVGLVLLPIVGNAAEHATAVTLALKNKMELAIGVAIGSSIQVALLIIPLLVVIGWGMHEDSMTLSFDLFQVGVLFFAIFLVNYLIADGKSHWLEGMLLISLYAIIDVCCWWYPESQ